MMEGTERRGGEIIIKQDMEGGCLEKMRGGVCKWSFVWQMGLLGLLGILGLGIPQIIQTGLEPVPSICPFISEVTLLIFLPFHSS